MKTRAMAERAVACGMPALALTDHGNLFGAVEFYLACRKAGVRPILGMEAYITRDRLDRTTEAGKQSHHLVLLATDLTGWRNLIRLASLGYLEGFYYKPRIDHELLAAHAQGLIGLSACLSGETSRRLLRDDLAGAIAVAGRYGEIFGRDHFYLEIQDHGLEPEAKVRQLMPQVARETGLPLVATNDCHFLQREHTRRTTSCSASRPTAGSRSRTGCATTPTRSTSRTPGRCSTSSGTGRARRRTRSPSRSAASSS